MIEEKTLIVINVAANSGAAKCKWETIEKEVLQYIGGEVIVRVYSPPFDLQSFFKEIIKHEYYQFIVGGGDGTINFVANILYELQVQGLLKSFTLGALALGSSNDFFKPMAHLINGIPVRINIKSARFEDIGSVKIDNSNGEKLEKIFLVNAGLGVTADANFLFNNPNKLINFLKPKATQLAILATALITIFNHSNKTITIRIQKKIIEVAMSNLSIILIPYISGSFHYNKERSEKNRFDIFLCKEMGRLSLLKTLIDLSRGEFKIGKGRIVYYSKNLRIKSKNDIPLEIDGEIFLGRSFDFELISKKICLAT